MTSSSLLANQSLIAHLNAESLGMESMSGTNVLDRARNALVSSPISTLRRLHVDVLDEAVVISGRVGSFYEKQMAQEAIRAVCRDVQVNNAVDVS